MRTLDRAITQDDFDGALVSSLSTEFRMPNVERYMNIGCPKIHLSLYSTIMRAYRLDEAQMIMLFPMSLSGATQRWFASLEVSCRRSQDDLVQELEWARGKFRGLVEYPRRKFRPSQSGPYFIRELTLDGAAWLTDLNGNQFSKLTNVDRLKKYYV